MPAGPGISNTKSESIMAGAAKIDITPQNSVFIGGYGQDRRSTGVHDPVWARSLVLDIGGRRIAFVSLDLVGLFLEDVTKIRNRASSEHLRANDIIVSCTHNHQGPDTLGLWGPSMGESGVDPSYQSSVVRDAAESVSQAEAELADSRARIAETRVEGVSKNARDKDVLDPTMIAMKFESTDCENIATLINFPNHPEALGSENTLISSDWPHYLYRKLEDTLGGICVYQNGALGGMVTPNVTSHEFSEVRRVGNMTAQAAIDVLSSASFMKIPRVAHAAADLRLPLDNDNFLKLRELGVIRRGFISEKVRTEIHYMRLGDLEILTIPGEALPKVGMGLKSLMDSPYRMLIGLGNDELGYIIPEEDFDRSKYEESMSVGPRTAPLMAEKARILVEAGV